MSRILVIDDEPSVLVAFGELLGGHDHAIETARRADVAITQIERDPPDLVITDLCLPGLDGLSAYRRIHALHPRLPVIIMTGQGTAETAIEATKLGAFDYILKPIDPEQMLRVVGQALEGARLMRGHVAIDAGGRSASGDAIIGNSVAIQQVYKAIGRVAQTDATVLIRGESGTGKELVARAIYQHSARNSEPLQVVNCVALPETLLESELFGYERGAFTGAISRRIGRFEQAESGTIFLDEIGDIPLSIQSKLLRVLQERSFERVGSNVPIRANVRVLAATNRDLEQAIAKQTFREDLFHRLNVVTIVIPSLRERREDIPLLVDYFVERFARELGGEAPAVSVEAMDVFLSHSWPGNIRELSHCIQRALIFTSGYAIQAADAKNALGETTGAIPAPGAWEESMRSLAQSYLCQNAGPAALERFLNTAERLMIELALKNANGKQTHAARLLDISRPTLHLKIHRHGLRSLAGQRQASES